MILSDTSEKTPAAFSSSSLKLVLKVGGGASACQSLDVSTALGSETDDSGLEKRQKHRTKRRKHKEHLDKKVGYRIQVTLHKVESLS